MLCVVVLVIPSRCRRFFFKSSLPSNDEMRGGNKDKKNPVPKKRMNVAVGAGARESKRNEGSLGGGDEDVGGKRV